MRLAVLLCLVPSLALAQGDPAPATEPAPVPSTDAAPATDAAPVPAPAPSVPVATPTTPVVEPATPLFAVPSADRLALSLEIFGDANYISRTGDNLSELRLDRGEVGAAVRMTTHTGAELRLESVRSAAEGGALGIDGNSLVVRIKRAQVYGDYERDQLRLDGALGMTPDPWIASLEDSYTVRPLSATASERLLGWQTSDLAALGRVSYGPARLSVSIGNGEGQRYPERNTGKTTTAVAEVVPLASPRVRLAAMFRDGSVGQASTRERRFGGSATVSHKLASAGVEVVRAQGVGDHGEVEATVVGAWGEVRPRDFLAVAGRFATARYDGGSATTGGGGLALVDGPTRLWLAVDRTTSSGTAMPLPTDAGTATTFQLIVSTTADFLVR
jgi:hypothetical protein